MNNCIPLPAEVLSDKRQKDDGGKVTGPTPNCEGQIIGLMTRQELQLDNLKEELGNQRELGSSESGN